MESSCKWHAYRTQHIILNISCPERFCKREKASLLRCIKLSQLNGSAMSTLQATSTFYCSLSTHTLSSFKLATEY